MFSAVRGDVSQSYHKFEPPAYRVLLGVRQYPWKWSVDMRPPYVLADGDTCTANAGSGAEFAANLAMNEARRL